jgi:hypothetical protein
MYDVGGVSEVYGGTFPTITWHDFMATALAAQPVLDFAPLNNALLPRSHYITSRSLVADDVLNHNGGYGYSYNGYNSYNGYGPRPAATTPTRPPKGGPHRKAAANPGGQ